MNHLIKKATVVSALAMSSSLAFAAESLNAKVVSVDGQKITLEATDKLPGWIEAGDTIQALGWKTKVVQAEGSQFVIELSKSRAARVEPDTEVVVREITETQKFGC